MKWNNRLVEGMRVCNWKVKLIQTEITQVWNCTSKIPNCYLFNLFRYFIPVFLYFFQFNNFILFLSLSFFLSLYFFLTIFPYLFYFFGTKDEVSCAIILLNWKILKKTTWKKIKVEEMYFQTSVFMYICLSLCLAVFLSVCLSVCLSVSFSLSLSLSLSLYLSSYVVGTARNIL